MTMLVVAGGVAKGLERLNNLLMPLLYLLLLVLAGHAATTSGFGPALSWLFRPDLSAVTPMVLVHAMGHAFFTLAVGACALMAYGAYMPDHQSLPRAAASVAVLDVTVALLAGIAIFSIVFAQGMDPVRAPADVRHPAGGLCRVALRRLLAVAVLPVAAAGDLDLVDQPRRAHGGDPAGWGISRGKAAAVVGLTVWSLGLLSVLSFSTLADVEILFGMNGFAWSALFRRRSSCRSEGC